MSQAPPAPVDPLKAPLWQQTLQSAVLEACRYFTHDQIREHVDTALASNAQPPRVAPRDKRGHKL